MTTGTTVNSQESHFLKWTDAILRTYASIIFSRRPAIGLLLLMATMNVPMVGLTGLVGVIVSLVFSRWMGFAPELWKQGFLSFNALLCSLGVATLFTLTWHTATLYILLLLLVSILSVMVTLSLNGIFKTYLALPVISVPFVLIALGLYLGTVFITGQPVYPPIRSLLLSDPTWLPVQVNLLLSSLGNLLFQNNAWAGLMMVFALLLESRISFLLALLGILEGWWLLNVLTFGDGLRHMGSFGFNCALTGMMLGGILIVPSVVSFLYAALGIGVCVFIGVALETPGHLFNIPVLAAPFNFSALLMLYILRFRTVIQRPTVVDFHPGSPEENLQYHLNRSQRLGQNSTICMRLPFLGKWTVTQPPESEPTHQPPWQHAWDFEVFDQDKKFRNNGTELADYYAYDLPVVAPADGTVVQVVDDVPDNVIGEFNAKQNWGNLIMLAHGYGIYSLICHLKPGSAKVKLHEFVKQGQLMGRCGNSGRSPVPHLHFHVQRSPQMNSPTCPSEFVRFIEESPLGNIFRLSHVPRRSAKLSNFVDDVALDALLNFHVGNEMKFNVRCAGKSGVESWKVKIDLFSNLFIESDRGAKMYFVMSGGLFTAVSFTGSRQSALYGFFIGASRIPFMGSELLWEDVLPARYMLGGIGKFFMDLMGLFGEPIKLHCASRIFREGELWKIESCTCAKLLKWELPGLACDLQLSFSSTAGIVDLCIQKGSRVFLQAKRILS